MHLHKCFEPTVGDVLYSLFLILHTRNVRLLALGFTIDLVSGRPGCLLIVILRRPPHFFSLAKAGSAHTYSRTLSRSFHVPFLKLSFAIFFHFKVPFSFSDTCLNFGTYEFGANFQTYVSEKEQGDRRSCSCLELFFYGPNSMK